MRVVMRHARRSTVCSGTPCSTRTMSMSSRRYPSSSDMPQGGALKRPSLVRERSRGPSRGASLLSTCRREIGEAHTPHRQPARCMIEPKRFRKVPSMVCCKTTLLGSSGEVRPKIALTISASSFSHKMLNIARAETVALIKVAGVCTSMSASGSVYKTISARP